jgi:hypothetical protein
MILDLYAQKLALTSPTSGGRSVYIVHLRTQATGLDFYHNSGHYPSSCFFFFKSSFLRLNCLQRQGLALTIEPKWVGSTWRRCALFRQDDVQNCDSYYSDFFNEKRNRQKTIDYSTGSSYGQSQSSVHFHEANTLTVPCLLSPLHSWL